MVKKNFHFEFYLCKIPALIRKTCISSTRTAVWGVGHADFSCSALLIGVLWWKKGIFFYPGDEKTWKKWSTIISKKAVVNRLDRQDDVHGKNWRLFYLSARTEVMKKFTGDNFEPGLEIQRQGKEIAKTNEVWGLLDPEGTNFVWFKSLNNSLNPDDKICRSTCRR